jgi:hypothetical protein
MSPLVPSSSLSYSFIVGKVVSLFCLFVMLKSLNPQQHLLLCS